MAPTWPTDHVLGDHFVGAGYGMAAVAGRGPTARAGRRLLEVLVDKAEARKRGLLPPRILTPGGLWGLLGEGAPARDAKTKAPALPRAKQVRTIELAAKQESQPIALPAPQPVKQQQQQTQAPRELPEGAPLAKREKTLPKFTLNEGAPVVQAPSIGPKTAKRLEAVGVKTIADLLALNADEGEQQIDARHISAKVIRDWQAQALLACTVPGMKSREAQALVACGVHDAQTLADSDATQLCEGVAHWGLSDEGQRAWGNAPAPTGDDVATWIERAKRAIQEGKSTVAA